MSTVTERAPAEAESVHAERTGRELEFTYECLFVEPETFRQLVDTGVAHIGEMRQYRKEPPQSLTGIEVDRRRRHGR